MWCFAKKKSLHESCIMGRRFVVMKLICPLGHSECDGHTVHKLSQRRLTADWLAPRESNCSRMHSKVSSDWLPSYIKATRPVLEIFKMVGYFLDSPRKLQLQFVCCVKTVQFNKICYMHTAGWIQSDSNQIVTLASSHSTFPDDDDDHAETCWSYCNFNANFNPHLRTILLCISW